MQLWTAVDGSWWLLWLRRTVGLEQCNGTAPAGGRKLATSAARRTSKHRCVELQKAGDQRKRVSRDAVDPVLDKHRKRTVLCVGRVLSNRNANVEFSEDDAICCAHGANRPIADTPGDKRCLEMAPLTPDRQITSPNQKRVKPLGTKYSSSVFQPVGR